MRKQEKNKELEKCQAEREEYLNSWRKAAADLINYKNEEGKRLTSSLEARTATLMREILPVLDSLGIALKQEDEKTCQGIKIIYDQLNKFLENQGVKEIKADPGDEFDPNFHEATMEVESEDEGKIAEVIVRGYAINEKVIRYTKVKIGKIKK